MAVSRHGKVLIQQLEACICTILLENILEERRIALMQKEILLLIGIVWIVDIHRWRRLGELITIGLGQVDWNGRISIGLLELGVFVFVTIVLIGRRLGFVARASISFKLRRHDLWPISGNNRPGTERDLRSGLECLSERKVYHH